MADAALQMVTVGKPSPFRIRDTEQEDARGEEAPGNTGYSRDLFEFQGDVDNLFAEIDPLNAEAVREDMLAMVAVALDPTAAPVKPAVLKGQRYDTALVQQDIAAMVSKCRKAGLTTDQTRHRLNEIVVTSCRMFGPDEPKAAKEGQNSGPKQSRFEGQWFEEFADEPGEEWLVQGLIVDKSTGVWAGHMGSLKSTALIDIACAIATGRPAFGEFKVNRPGAVAWIAGEDKGSVGPRIKAWMRENNYTGKVAIFRVPAIPKSTADQEWVELCKVLDARKPADGWRFMCLDTVSKSVTGENENEASTMAQFATRMDDLRGYYGCAVHAVSHKARNTDEKTLATRGSTALLADTECGVNVRKIEADEHGRAKVAELHFERFKRKTPFKLSLAVKSVVLGTLKDGTTDDAAVLCYDATLAEKQKQERQDRARARTFEETVLHCLEWYSGWKSGEKSAPIKLTDVATALARPDAWINPAAPGMAAPELVLDASTLTEDQRRARDTYRRHKLARLAVQWGDDPARRALLPARLQKGTGYTFEAHAASRLGRPALPDDGGEQ